MRYILVYSGMFDEPIYMVTILDFLSGALIKLFVHHVSIIYNHCDHLDLTGRMLIYENHCDITVTSLGMMISRVTIPKL